MKIFLFFIMLFLSSPCFSQMPDLMGTLAIQGAITNQSAQSVSRGLSMARQNKILQDLQQTVIEIQTNHIGNYNSVGKHSVFGSPFSGLDWQVAPYGSYQFYIQLNQIDEATCRYLIGQRLSASEIIVNQSGTTCSQSNNIRFIFN